MKLSNVSAVFVLTYCSLVAADEAKFTEVQQNELQALIQGLNEYNQAHAVQNQDTTGRVLLARSEIPILDSILAALSDSGLANSVIDFVLLNPTLLDISANSVIFALRSGLVNLTDVFIALEKSGLIIQTINLALDNPQILAGVLAIGKDFLELNGIHLFNREDVIEEDAQESQVSVTKRESEFLNELLTSLKDSGLAASVILHLLTTPQLAQPSAYFVNQIVHSHAITVGQILDATLESNIIWNLFRQILSDKELLDKFAAIVSDRISRGLISKEMWDQAS